MRCVIVTGAIGAGKSTTAKLMNEEAVRRYGAEAVVHLDADLVVRELYDPGTEVFKAVVEHFGDEILDDTGEIDRPKLAEKVFSDPVDLAFLEGLTHPVVRETVRQRTQAAREAGAALFIIEMQLLEKSGLEETADMVIVVEAAESLRLRRLSARGIPAEEARRRMEAGPNPYALTASADIILENNSSIEDLFRQIRDLFDTSTL